MGQVSSALGSLRDTPTVSVPDNYTTPEFPSLYGPSFVRTQNQEGIFLYEADAIWHFTLYWALLLVGGLFLICSLLASLNLILSLTSFRPQPAPSPSSSGMRTPPVWFNPGVRPRTIPGGTPESNPPLTPATTSTPLVRERDRGIKRIRPKPPSLWMIALIPIVSCVVGAVISLISATVVGFALAAIYSAGGFVMSTWVPFLWGLIQALVLIISSYSTLTSIL